MIEPFQRSLNTLGTDDRGIIQVARPSVSQVEAFAAQRACGHLRPLPLHHFQDSGVKGDGNHLVCDAHFFTERLQRRDNGRVMGFYLHKMNDVRILERREIFLERRDTQRRIHGEKTITGLAGRLVVGSGHSRHAFMGKRDILQLPERQGFAVRHISAVEQPFERLVMVDEQLPIPAQPDIILNHVCSGKVSAQCSRQGVLNIFAGHAAVSDDEGCPEKGRRVFMKKADGINCRQVVLHHQAVDPACQRGEEAHLVTACGSPYREQAALQGPDQRP